MKLGFTGTQSGMTEAQKAAFIEFIDDNEIDEFHHGDCIGSDSDAHVLVLESYRRIPIHLHPPTNPAKRAFCKGDREFAPLPYLDRNREIVGLTNVLIATPKGPEELRSGTWATIRYARKLGHPVVIVWPDGSSTREGAPME